AGCVHAVRFVAEYPAEHVEVMYQHILEDTSGDLDIADRRRTRIPAGYDQHFRIADFAGVEALLQGREGGIEAPLEDDHAQHTSLRNRVDACARAIEREIDRLF